MANLSYQEKACFEELLGMSSGYILDFSNNTFGRFVGDITNIDIYAGRGYEEYCSKANKLRQIWSEEPDNVVGTLMDAMLSYYEDYQLKNDKLTDYQKKKIGEMRLVCQRLMGDAKVVLPKKSEETLQTLLEDINNSLTRNKPTLALDRLHTYATKLIRQFCTDNGIKVTNDKGEYYALHSLAGMLKKHYEKNPLLESEFTITAMQESISLFDRYNNIRNDQSYAHDNEVLDNLEANFAVKTMANLLTFIDGVETYRKRIKANETQTEEVEWPF